MIQSANKLFSCHCSQITMYAIRKTSEMTESIEKQRILEKYFLFPTCKQELDFRGTYLLGAKV